VRKSRILTVDDDKIVHSVYRRVLSDDRYEIVSAFSGQECLAMLARDVFDMVLLDIRMPDMDGIQVLEHIRRGEDPDVAVIIVTGKGTLESAIEALRLGANDYLTKPFGADPLVAAVERELEATKLKRELRHLRAESRRAHQFDSIAAQSPQMQKVFETMAKVAASPVSGVLIRGETGTGKRLIAQAIHYSSARSDRPFVQVNCTAIPEALLEVELFGNERGAFTDAQERRTGQLEHAEGGTLFLDEIGHMPLVMQPKLLNFIEEKTFRRVGGTEDLVADVRVIAATNRDLLKAIRDGEFRQDLYYRLEVVPIDVPALRHRTGDIPLLARHFVRQFSAEFGKEIVDIDDEGLSLLERHTWPGNVRELRNVIERAVLLASDNVLRPADLSIGTRPHPTGLTEMAGRSIEEVERMHILSVLASVDGNRTRAAEILGVSTETLRRKLKEWGQPALD
jgi:DNA-binding NtrC family response regulator